MANNAVLASKIDMVLIRKQDSVFLMTPPFRKFRPYAGDAAINVDVLVFPSSRSPQ